MYLFIDHFPRSRGIDMEILAGATAAGIFAGSSNLNIGSNGSSFWPGGFDGGAIAALLIVDCSITGYFLTPGQKPIETI